MREGAEPGPQSAAAPAPGAPGARRASAPVTLAIAALGVAALLLHARHYLPFLADDALISLRYARRLLDGHGLTWTDGDRVEGYSNLLWILATSALGRLGVDLVAAARALGVAGMAAALLALARVGARRSAAAAVVACVAFALAAPAAVWTIGGLEQPLVAALLAWCLALLLPRLEQPGAPARAFLPPALLLGLLCWTRPDGPVFVTGACAGLLLAGRARPRALLALALPPLAFVLAQLAFRRAYYHEWLPNPAFAKLAFSPERLREGASYVAKGLAYLAPLVLAAAAGWFAPGPDPARRRRLRFLGALLALWCAYVVAIGGDIFPARRHLVPVVLVLAVMAGEAVAAWRQRLGSRALTACAAALLALLLVLQGRDPESRRALGERWEWRGQVVGRLLARAFGSARPLIAVDPAGCVPYFSGLPAIDMLGLNDRYLAHHPPATLGEGRLGHELGSGRYVLARAPDLVLFNGPGGGRVPAFPSGIQMAADPEFAARYRLTNLDGFDPFFVRCRIWVRVDGRLGIARSPGRVVVPGWLLCADSTSAARLDAPGGLGMVAGAARPARIEGLALAPGAWSLAVEGSGRCVASVRDHAQGVELARGAGALTFTLPAGPRSAVDIAVAPAADTAAWVRRVVLVRRG